MRPVGVFGFRKNYSKRFGMEENVKNSKIKKMTVIAMLSAMAYVLMLFEFPLWFVPPFYKLDLSELPVMIGAFALGPIEGIIIEAIKIILNIVIEGSSTGYVGEFANFSVGCMYVVPAAVIYKIKKTKKMAIVGMLVGTCLMSITGCFINAYVMLPLYSEMFMPMDKIIAAGTDVNSLITNMRTFIVFGVLPFNIIKCVIVSLITGLLYKHVAHLLK